MYDSHFDPWLSKDVTPTLIPTAVTHRQTSTLMSTPLTASKSCDWFETELLTIDETSCNNGNFQKHLNETREQMHRSQEVIREEVTAFTVKEVTVTVTQKLVLEQMSITQQILENQVEAQKEWQRNMETMQNEFLEKMTRTDNQAQTGIDKIDDNR